MIKDKINKYAFSGGRQTVEEHRELGADLDVDVSFQYLMFFLDDDEQLEDIRVKYSKGEMLTGEVKKILVDTLQKWLTEFQERRAKVTDQDVKDFMEIRKINPYPTAWADVIAEREAAKEQARKEKEEAAKKAAEGDEGKKAAAKAKKEAAKKAAKDFAIAKKKAEEEKKAAEAKE